MELSPAAIPILFAALIIALTVMVARGVQRSRHRVAQDQDRSAGELGP